MPPEDSESRPDGPVPQDGHLGPEETTIPLARASLVNGPAAAVELGLVSSKALINGKGPVNGRGLVNGNGLVNGKSLVNGKGLVNGQGLVNGKGLVNGASLVNGEGLVNGKGRVNRNGLINGKGLTNGGGLVNGLDMITGQHHIRSRLSRRRRKWRLAGAVAFLLVALILIPALAVFLGSPQPPIEIDGSFGDWDGRPAALVSTQMPVGNRSIELRTVRFLRLDGQLAFELETWGPILRGSPAERGLDSFLLLVDCDPRSDTGYSAEGIGADWLVEVSGMSNRVSTVSLSRFDTARSPDDWNGWLLTASGRACARGERLEGKVPLGLSEGPAIRIYGFDAAGNKARPDDILSSGPMVRARFIPYAPLMAMPGDIVTLARIVFEATSDTVLDSMGLLLNSTRLDGISLELWVLADDGLEGITPGDFLLASGNGTGPWQSIQFGAAIPLLANVPKALWISVLAPDRYCTVGLEKVLPHIAKSDWPLSIERLPLPAGSEEKVTVGHPVEMEIDGAFADWSRLPSGGRLSQDPSGDVNGGENADLDLLEIGRVVDGPDLFLSATVRGIGLAGTVIPFEIKRAAPDIPQPAEPKTPVPAPAPVPRLGSDRTEFFISTGGSDGYRPEWLGAGAQYLLAIEGREGRVLYSTLERFSGKDAGEWKWSPVSTMPAATGGSRIEASVPRSALPGIGEDSSVFVRTTDWNRSQEDLASPKARPLLQFAGATFDPLEGVPDLPPAYVTHQAAGYFVIQLDVPVTDVFLLTAEAFGATAMDFIPTFGMVVFIPSNDPTGLERLEHVRWVGIHQPAFRVDPELLDRTGTLALKVSAYQRPGEVALRLAQAGATVKDTPASVMKVEADAAILPAIAAIPDVKFIEPVANATIHNNIARGITNVNLTTTVFGLTGKGQIIAIADTGLDTGNDSDGQPNHPDFNGRVVKWYDVVKAVVPASTGSYTRDPNNHGTHVAGTAAGGGNVSNRPLLGVAPEAGIIVQGLMDDSGKLKIYSDLRNLYSGPYNDGAGVHQNSWGYTVSGGMYLSDCEETDDFVWDNQTFVIVYSAGNDGNDGSGDANTTTPPGTSKNVITVGASESLRPWSDSDGDNTSEIAVFSSRGGTLDGRIKPDIVAPGTWILSTRSANGTSAGWGYYSKYYLYEGGTSMAAPHVSGAAVLVRQYFTDYENITPSAALVKATLINGADDLGTANIPNMNEGWGRLNLTNSLFPEKPRVMRYVDNKTGLNSSDPAVLLNFTVGNSSVPLKFTLVWSDYPGSYVTTDSAPKLINDLDITVTAPNGSVYNGNVFTAGWSTTGGSADKLNNVECVYFNAPARGTYAVNITPANISKGPQPFSLVISGELVPDLNVTNVTTTPADAKPGDDVTIKATVVNCGSENLPPLFKESFSSMDIGVSENITDVAFSPDGSFALLVGANRTVVKYNTSNGTFTTIDTSSVPWTDFEGVAFNPKNHPGNRGIPEALLVGTNGTVVNYNGTGFTNVSGPASNETLLDVAWNENGTVALVVGQNGRVYAFPNTTVVLSDDFESGDGSWSVSANTNWGNATSQNVSPIHSMHIQSSKVMTEANYYLTLANDQNLSVARSAYVEFQNRYYRPSGGDNVGRVYLSKDGSTYYLQASYFTYTDSTIGWTTEILDASGFYPSSQFNVLFYEYSNQNNKKGDWWIDDVFINKTVYAAASLSTLNSSAILRGVQFVPGTDDAVLVGDGGIAWKYSGGTLSNLSSGTTSDLRALSFKPQNMTCLIVGDNGTVIRYDASDQSFTSLTFPDGNASLWDIAYRRDFSISGPKPDCSQALLVGESGTAWQFFGYDDHFNNVSIAETKTFYGVAFNNTRYPLYGPGLLVGYGSGPVVKKDSPEMTFRPFLVDFYTDNSSYSSNWLGRVQVDEGLAPDPYPPWGVNVTVSFLWKSAPNGSYNITVRVDITNNESASPPSPDRINEVEEWTNNQLSMNLLLVPEFDSVVVPLVGAVAVFIVFRRARQPFRRSQDRKPSMSECPR